MRPARTPRGAIAIVADEFPSNPAAAKPTTLEGALRGAGFGVTLLKAGDLSDGAALNKANFDVLILPNGVYYPAAGHAALLAFLKAGGSFLSVGGYAFDNPVAYTAAGWRTVQSVQTAATMDEQKTQARINARFGRPGDTMGLDPEQIADFESALIRPLPASAPVATANPRLKVKS
jgi:hypothetical protein